MYGIFGRLSVCLLSLSVFLFSHSPAAFASIVPQGDGCPKILKASEEIPKLGVPDLGNYLPRGGALIPVEKAPSQFTVVVKDPNAATELDAVPGLVNKRRVRSSTYLLEVDAAQLEQAMEFARNKGLVAHHAYKVQANEPADFFLTERVVVRVRAGVTPDGAKQLATDLGLTFDSAVPGLDNTYIFNVTAKAGKNPIKAANEVAKHAQVDWAEPDLINRLTHDAPVIPKDELFAKQWHLHRGRANLNLTPEQLAQYSDDAGIDAPGAWETTKGDPNIVVAILDDGFDLDHPDLKDGAKKIVAPHDYSDGDSEPFPGQSDYHGTPCAGVALAAMNDDGTVGVAPGCAFMPVRFPLNVSDTELRTIFENISKNADVVSCSWGPPPVYAPLSTLVKDTFTELHAKGGRRGKGLAIAFAAGNSNAPINDPDNKEFEWLDFGWGITRTTKGPILNGYVDHPGVFGVAGSNSLAKKSAFSSWGKGVNVAAPTNNFDPINPRKAIPGLGIVTTDNEKVGEGFNKDSIYTDRFGGTSSATPTVAGLLGLVLSANPELTAAEAYKVVEDTTDRIEDDSTDTHLGTSYGKYEKDETGRPFSKWFGYGRINAKKAVERAKQMKDARASANAQVGAFLRDFGGLSETSLKSLLRTDEAFGSTDKRKGLARLLNTIDRTEAQVSQATRKVLNDRGVGPAVKELYSKAYEIAFAALVTGQAIPDQSLRNELRTYVLRNGRS